MPAFGFDSHVYLTRYLSGDCSAAEAAELEVWLAADDTRRLELDALRQLWETSAGIPPSSRVDEMWRELTHQLQDNQPLRPTISESATAPPSLILRRPPRADRAAWWRWGVGLAAAAGLALAVRYRVHLPNLGDHSRLVATSVPKSATPRQSESVREYRTRRGQRSTIQLGDGTRIELGVASVLRVYPFVGARRNVELDGEAVFDVVHDAARPFTVWSHHTAVEDLGTRFGVHAYHSDKRVRVAVAEGKVAVRPNVDEVGAATVLLPGDVGVVRVDTVNHMTHSWVEVQHDVSTEAYFGWTSGRLFFDNTTLAEVAASLERWYDVEVVVATPSLANRRVTVSMPLGSLTDALDAVTAPFGLAYAKRGSVVSLYAK